MREVDQASQAAAGASPRLPRVGAQQQVQLPKEASLRFRVDDFEAAQSAATADQPAQH